ncbi:MAG: cytochrome P450 family protein, partial [Dehalococcoidia bacterium]
MSVKTAALGAVQAVAIQGLMLKERLSTGVSVNVLSGSFRENPYPTYRRLLAKDPVHWSSMGKAWMLTRQADVMLVLRDPRFAADRSPAMEQAGMNLDEMGPFNRWFSKTVLSLDPPNHTRLRTLASKAFTPRSVEVMRPRMAQIVGELLDAVQERGTMDLISDLAYPLPVIVIAEMLGVPAEDRSMFKRWSDAVGEGLEPIQTAEQIRNADKAVVDLSEYFRGIIRERRRAPREDLISA